MARCAAAGRGVTNAPTSLRGPCLYASAAGGGFTLREVGVFNTTSTACAVGLMVASAAGTQAGGLTEYQIDDPEAPAPSETAFTSQSADATLVAQVRQASLGAAVGAGVIWTFGDQGLIIKEGTANGVVINCPTGTGQFWDFYFVWDK